MGFERPIWYDTQEDGGNSSWVVFLCEHVCVCVLVAQITMWLLLTFACSWLLNISGPWLCHRKHTEFRAIPMSTCRNGMNTHWEMFLRNYKYDSVTINPSETHFDLNYFWSSKLSKDVLLCVFFFLHIQFVDLILQIAGWKHNLLEIRRLLVFSFWQMISWIVTNQRKEALANPCGSTKWRLSIGRAEKGCAS